MGTGEFNVRWGNPAVNEHPIKGWSGEGSLEILLVSFLIHNLYCLILILEFFNFIFLTLRTYILLLCIAKV